MAFHPYPNHEHSLASGIKSGLKSDLSEDHMAAANVRLLSERQRLTEDLYQRPYDLIRHLERAHVHSDLGYPDLAAGDAYRALLLCDEINDEGFEYYDQALEALQVYSLREIPEVLQSRELSSSRSYREVDQLTVGDERGLEQRVQLAKKASLRCFRILSISLLLCGGLKSAYDFCTRGLVETPDDEVLKHTNECILDAARKRLKVEHVNVNDLPEQGLARREIYPWNNHEPDRLSDGTLDFLNSELREVASRCEVKATYLPTLLQTSTSREKSPTNKQLGLFATEDIAPGDTILDEYTVLTANNGLKVPFCDACSTRLPPLGPGSTVIGCSECTDTMFCNEYCFSQAQALYHPSICDKDQDTIARDPSPQESPNALYLLLLFRTFAMSATQSIHPLDLKQVKYIWGDFSSTKANEMSLRLPYDAGPPPNWTLPFSFASNILNPLHFLEKMDIDIYAHIEDYDFWIFNTLYSKFRGTASASLDARTGIPDVAAVHSLWCLANHDCEPNVQWAWGGRMKLWCRETSVSDVKGGIKKGEEIFNHYCDVDLPVKERREWAKGSLGGDCICERCKREAKEDGADIEAQRSG